MARNFLSWRKSPKSMYPSRGPATMIWRWLRAAAITVLCRSSPKWLVKRKPRQLPSIDSSGLAEVRHEGGQKSAKCCGISSGNGRVYTTFAVTLKPIGQVQPQLTKQSFLLVRRFSDAAQTDFTAIGGRQNNVGALERREQGEGTQGRDRLSLRGFRFAGRSGLGWQRSLPLEQMLQGDPQRISQKGNHHMSFDARFQLMKQGSNRKLALERPKGSFGFGQLHVLRPQLFGRFGL